MRKLIGLSVVALAAASANAQFCGSANPNLAIPDASAVGVTSTINVGSNFGITGIGVKVQINNNLTTATPHTWVGDLLITITAPNGSVATLMNRPSVGVSSSTVGSNSDFGGLVGERFVGRTGAQNFSILGCGATDTNLQPFGGTAGSPPGATGGNVWSAAGSAGAPAPTLAAGGLIPQGDYVASSNTGAGTTYAARYVEVDLMALLGGGPANGNWTIKVSDHASGDTGRLISWQLQLLPEPASLALVGLGAFGLLRRRK